MDVDIRLVDKFQQDTFDALLRRNLESKGIFIPVSEYKTSGYRNIEKPDYKIRIGAFVGEQLVGLSYGAAESKHRFLMHVSLVEEDYRCQGIYTKMLKMMLAETKEFDEVDSCHHLFNNKILAIKLRHNFYIVGIDQSILIGPRIRMRYYHNSKLLELMKYRVGKTKDPRELSLR